MTDAELDALVARIESQEPMTRTEAAEAITALRAELAAERERVQRLHRRQQHLEGPFESKLAGANASCNYWKVATMNGDQEVQRLMRAVSAIAWITKNDRDYPVSNRVWSMAEAVRNGREITW